MNVVIGVIYPRVVGKKLMIHLLLMKLLVFLLNNLIHYVSYRVVSSYFLKASLKLPDETRPSISDFFHSASYGFIDVYVFDVITTSFKFIYKVDPSNPFSHCVHLKYKTRGTINHR